MTIKRPKAKWGWKGSNGGWVDPFIFPKRRRDTLLRRNIPNPVVMEMEGAIASLRTCLSADKGEPTRPEITAALKAIQKPVSDLVGMFAKLDDATRRVLIDRYMIALLEEGRSDQVWLRAGERFEQTRPCLDTLNRATGAAVESLAAIDGRTTQKGLQRQLAHICDSLFRDHGLVFTAAPKGQACQLLAEAFAAFGLTQDPRPYIREIIAKSRGLAKSSRAAG